MDLLQPPLKDGDVLVSMRKVSINPLDNTFRSGHHYAATPGLPCGRHGGDRLAGHHEHRLGNAPCTHNQNSQRHAGENI